MSTPAVAFVRLVKQRHDTDCSVATLATFLARSYEEVLLAIKRPDVLSKGVYVRAVVAAAKRLGKPLKLRQRFDVENDTGILVVYSKTRDFKHLVVLMSGLIIDCQDATIWDYDAYMAVYEARTMGLLALKEDQ